MGGRFDEKVICSLGTGKCPCLLGVNVCVCRGAGAGETVLLVSLEMGGENLP